MIKKNHFNQIFLMLSVHYCLPVGIFLAWRVTKHVKASEFIEIEWWNDGELARLSFHPRMLTISNQKPPLLKTTQF